MSSESDCQPVAEGALRKLQLEELSLLKEFERVCEENGYSYFALGGTLLGAVRHKGFIPWDDDVDIAMPRHDYEAFLRLPSKTFASPFKLSTFETDTTNRYPWARLISERMKIINHTANKPRVEYAWIDIIPLDGIPDRGIARLVYKIRLSFWWNLNQIIQFDELVDQHRKRSVLGVLSLKLASMFKWINKVVDYRICLRKLNAILMSCPYESDTKEIINYLAAYGFNEIFPRTVFESSCSYEFEDLSIAGPTDYDCVCKIIYGEDYMTPPPVTSRNKHHAEILDD